MDIPVGVTSDMNPEGNIGNLVQMIKMARLDKSIAEGNNADIDENDAENENRFLQVLQQNMAILLQSDKADSSLELTSKQDLSLALGKLLQEDQNVASEILSGLTLLAIAGKAEGFVTPESECPEDSLSKLMASSEMTGILKNEFKALTDQIKDALFQNEKGTLVSEPTPGKNAVLSDVASAINPKDQSTEKTHQGLTPSIKDIQTSGLENYAAAEGILASIEEQDEVPLLKDMKENSFKKTANDTSRQILPEESIKTIDTPEHQANTITSYSDVQKKVAIEGKNETPPLIKMEGIPVAEKVSEESQMIKAGASATGNVLENKSSLNISYKAQIEEEYLNAQSEQDQAGQDGKKKISVRSDNTLAEKQLSLSLNDAQKNIAGKIAESAPASAGVIDKIKSEFKGKTGSIEKNIESNSLNASTLSGIGSAKTEISDVLPAQIINRVTAEFNEKLASEGGRVKITLAPPSLGNLELDVMVRNGTVKVMLIADNKDVQQMLSGNLESLKGSLQNQGLTIERCDVMMQDRHDQSSQNFKQQTFNQDHSNKPHDGSGESYQPDVLKAEQPINRPLHEGIRRLGNISLFV